jgi:hypothetical protein
MNSNAKIYVGPNNKMLGLYTFMRFPEGFPKHIQDAVDADPVLAARFQPWEFFIKQPPPGAVPRTSKKRVIARALPPIPELHRKFEPVGLSTPRPRRS